ncbi:TetR/AcrR family transcriptional regulator [Streptomyces sp. NPDC014870]|uniref:TetR/AcrR family transcriptional regulator n=1 Tax=Streptomyces sp. NPDC014870 TaxID=3364925 RepID=UPI0036F9EF27
MTAFQRARSEEQREVRRRAILDTTAAMLDTMPVSEISLNELSRRTGLAKSNVLRYFESREAILLELFGHACKEWLAELAARLPADIDPSDPVTTRGDHLAAALARSLSGHRVLCDLLAAQAAVLEHNVSPEAAARHKRAAHADLMALAELILRHLPELGDDGAWKASATTVLFTGALWPHTQPAPSMLAAYESDPDLAAMRMDFCPTLEEALATQFSGLLARTRQA